MANRRRLAELGMNTVLSVEVAKQIEGAIAAKTQVAALTAIATVDATDPATTMALANECKAKINAVIAALKA
ncbi:hypothetical protein [Devosia sp. DBB001]|nr:hypothetical protein [Devosia sp. DBB001]